MTCWSGKSDLVEQQTAEIVRLRSALQQILKSMEANGMGEWKQAKIAQKALEKNES